MDLMDKLGNFLQFWAFSGKFVQISAAQHQFGRFFYFGSCVQIITTHHIYTVVNQMIPFYLNESFMYFHWYLHDRNRLFCYFNPYFEIE
jgi:hypothetical protein